MPLIRVSEPVKHQLDNAKSWLAEVRGRDVSMSETLEHIIRLAESTEPPEFP